MLSKPFIIFFMGIIPVLCCTNADESRVSSKSEIEKSDSATKKNLKNDKTDSTTNTQHSLTTIRITDKAVVKVLSTEKIFDSASKFSKKYKGKCGNWRLSKNDIEHILTTSPQIDGHEFHYYYDILPCYYKGEATIDGNSVKFEVNAGASTVLILKDSSIYLGYKQKDYKKYFLEGPGID